MKQQQFHLKHLIISIGGQLLESNYQEGSIITHDFTCTLLVFYDALMTIGRIMRFYL